MVRSDIYDWKPGFDFISRREELSRLKDAIADITGSEPIKPRFIHFYGTAGIGKSTLLQECRDLCWAARVPAAYISFEEDRLRKSDDPYGQALYIILDHLADGPAEDELEGLLARRKELQIEVTTASAAERPSANRELKAFDRSLVERLVQLAEESPVVLFVDGVEDASDAVRERVEALLARFAEASRALVISASRAPLEITWRSSLRSRFDEIHLDRLDSEDVRKLIARKVIDANAEVVRDGPLMQYVQQIAQGHPQVSLALARHLADIVGRQGKDKVLRRAQSDDDAIRRQLLDNLYDVYIEGFVLRALEPWAKTVYEASAPMRRFSIELLNNLAYDRYIPELRGTGRQTLRDAVDRLRERGLVYWQPGRQYKLDFLPRYLLVQRMSRKETERQKLIATTEALVRRYRDLVDSPGEALDQSVVIVEYLYHLAFLEKVKGRSLESHALQADLLRKLSRCIERNRDPEIIDSVLHQLRDDEELTQLFGEHLLGQMRDRLKEFESSVRLRQLKPADELSGLVQEFLRGNCILFVGPGITFDTQYLAAERKIAAYLAEKGGLPIHSPQLEEVAQYYVSRKGRDSLVEEVTSQFEELEAPDEGSLESIASLPLDVLVTTARDSNLFNTLQGAQKSLVCTTSLRDAPRLGRGDVLLVELRGSTREPETLVLTEDEHWQLRRTLDSSENLLSSYLAKRTPVFLGFRLDDPLLQVIHGRMLIDAPTQYSYVALDESPSISGEMQSQERLIILEQSSQKLLVELQHGALEQRAKKERVLRAKEALEMLIAGESLADRRLNGIEFSPEVDLMEPNLSESKLSSGILNGVDLSNAILTNADLNGALLEGARLTDVQADGLSMIYAKADKVDLRRASLKNGVLMGTALREAKLSGADLKRSDWMHAELTGSHGKRVDFSRADMTSANLSSVRLPDARFTYSLLLNTRFDHSDLLAADFSQTRLFNVTFEDTNLRGANFQFSYLSKVDFSGADVRDVDFTRTVLENVDLSRAKNVETANFQDAFFMDGVLMPDHFTETKDVEKQAPPREHISEDEATLVREFLDRNCVLIVGPGLSLGADYLGVWEQVGAALARDLKTLSSQRSFEDIAQSFVLDRGRPQLVAKVEEQLMPAVRENRDRGSSSLVAALASSLPLEFIATTAIDNELQKVLVETPRPLTVANSLDSSVKSGVGDTLLLNLRGSLDEPGTLVLTRRDRGELERKLASGDNLLSQYLEDKRVLFIGFDPQDPMLRTIFTSIRGGRSEQLDQTGFVIAEEIPSYLSEYWRSRGLVALEQVARPFLMELRQKMLEQTREEVRVLSAEDVLKMKGLDEAIAGRLMVAVEFEPGTDLQGLDLHDCNITSATLSGVQLDNARLDGTELSGADLKGASLKGCQANGVNLLFAKANRADFSDAHMVGALMMGAQLEEARLKRTSLVDADLPHINLRGALGDEGTNFARSNLTNAELSETQSGKRASFPRSSFRDALLLGTRFTGAKLAGADFRQVNAAGATFEGADLTNVNFEFSNLTDVDFSGADVRGVNFAQTALTGTDLRDAQHVMEAEFTGALWEDARLPDELRRKLEQEEEL